jgi:hypothetical protein
MTSQMNFNGFIIILNITSAAAQLSLELLDICGLYSEMFKT